MPENAGSALRHSSRVSRSMPPAAAARIHGWPRRTASRIFFARAALYFVRVPAMSLLAFLEADKLGKAALRFPPPLIALAGRAGIVMLPTPVPRTDDFARLAVPPMMDEQARTPAIWRVTLSAHRLVHLLPVRIPHRCCYHCGAGRFLIHRRIPVAVFAGRTPLPPQQASQRSNYPVFLSIGTPHPPQSGRPTGRSR